MSYIGSTPQSQNFVSGTDYFNGTGSQTAFTLTRAVNSVNDVEVVVNNVIQQPNTAYTISGTTITFTSAPSSGTSNIYVRYLSTTTQSITPSQGTVSYSTLNSDNQSKLGISFKNRIINGAMVIDQRNAGASVSGNDGVFVVDRWRTETSQSGKLTMQQNQSSVTPPAGFRNYIGLTSSSAYSLLSTDRFGLAQWIEGYNVADLGFGTANARSFTFSFWVRSSLTGNFGVGLLGYDEGSAFRSYVTTYTISSANTWTYVSITVPGDTSGTWSIANGHGLYVNFNLGYGSNYTKAAGSWGDGLYYGPTGATSVVGTSGATFYITGVQLEVGTTATNFDFRSITTELQLCQRYYAKIGLKAGAFIGAGNTYSAALGAAYVKYPVTMRTNPTASFSNLTAGDGYNYGRSVASFGSSQIGSDSSQIALNVSPTDMVASRVFVVYPATDAGYLDFSAEL